MAPNSHTIQKEFSPASQIEESRCSVKVVFTWKFYYEERGRVRATVKAGTQERGMEVIWFHTGNYTEMCRKSQSTVASQQLLVLESCNSTAILRKPSSLSLKTFRQL